jgi:hypothetical protein
MNKITRVALYLGVGVFAVAELQDMTVTEVLDEYGIQVVSWAIRLLTGGLI